MASLRIKAHVSLCLLVLIVHCLRAQPLQAATPGVVLVAATIDGHAGVFLLDTGANRSCLDTEFAERLGLEVESSANLTRNYAEGAASNIRVREFGIGPVHLHDVSMLSADLSAPFARGGVAIDGIIGTDVLRLAVVTIDFSSGSARFAMGGQTPIGEQMIELQPVDGLYFVSLIVQGTSTRLLLDTGTNFTSVSSAAWSRVTTHWRPPSMLDGIRSTGGSNNAQFVLIPKISVGGSSSNDVPLRIQPRTQSGLFSDAAFDGLLGSDLLQSFLVTLDLANNRMYLAHNRNSHVDRYLFSTIGIQFAKNDDGRFTIMAVWTPSPAATAGLQIGDIILAVNNLDVRPISLDELSRQFHGEPGRKLDLDIESAGQNMLCPSRSVAFCVRSRALYSDLARSSVRSCFFALIEPNPIQECYMTQHHPMKTSSHAASQSVHDRVNSLRNKLQRLRESDASRQEEALAMTPMRFVSVLHPKRWTRSKHPENEASIPIAGVIAAWLIYLAFGAGIMALVFHVAAKH